MADSNVPITAGSGTLVDTRTIGSEHRQVVCVGDETTSAVLPVDATAGAAVHIVTHTAGGNLTFHRVSSADTNQQNVKASAGQLFSVTISNKAVYPVYVKIHNTAGTPTAGSGVTRTCGVQAGSDQQYLFPNGLPYATGIAITIVKGITDADATAVALSDCVVDVEYK
jgi:hypothetical protein